MNQTPKIHTLNVTRTRTVRAKFFSRSVYLVQTLNVHAGIFSNHKVDACTCIIMKSQKISHYMQNKEEINVNLNFLAIYTLVLESLKIFRHNVGNPVATSSHLIL